MLVLQKLLKFRMIYLKVYMLLVLVILVYLKH